MSTQTRDTRALEPVPSIDGHEPSIPPVMLPWPLIAANLVAYVALFLFGMTSDTSTVSNIAIPLIALALVGSRLSTYRMPHSSWAPWVLRVVAIGFIAATFPRSDTGKPALFDPGSILLVGMIWATEAAIQAWRERPWGDPPGASLILLSILAFTAASTTGDEYPHGQVGNYVIVLTPLFILLIVLSFRALDASIRPRESSAMGTVLRLEPQPANIGRRSTFVRFAYIAAALAVGASIWLPVRVYHSQITTWGDNLLQNRNIPEATGLSTAPALGDMIDASGSPTRVLRIDGYHGDAHLRGLSFETYTHGRWLPAEDSLRFEPISLIALRIGATGDKAHVHCYADGLHEIVAPLDIAGIIPGKDVEVEKSDYSGRILRVNAAAPYTYDLVQSKSVDAQGVLCTSMTPEERRRCLDVPPDVEPGVWALARSIWPGSRSALDPTSETKDKIAAVTNYILEHYTYSLTKHSGTGDKISHFLLHEHSAHCEYFASSAVILLRILGVPSRYVTGYYAHETEGGSTVVRQRDSHAWTECWVDGIGWVTVDTTPGGGRPDKLYPSGGFLTRLWEYLSDRIADMQELASHYTPLQITLTFAAGAFLFFGFKWLLTRRRHQVPAQCQFAYENRGEALVDMARRFDEYLSAIGAPCPATTPWREHLESLDLPRIAGRASTGTGSFGPTSIEIVSTDRALAVDIPLAIDFVKTYNSLRFRHEFDAELASDANTLLELLVQKEAN